MSHDIAPFLDRRNQLLERIGEGVVVLPAAPVFIRNNDVEHAYRQDSDFWYLTAFDEPEAVLVLRNVGGERSSVLFLRERNIEREIWDGPRLGVERAPGALAIDEAYPIGELASRLPRLLLGASHLHAQVGRAHPFDASLFDALAKARGFARRSGDAVPNTIVDFSETLHEMRLRKSKQEVAAMEAAAAISAAAHRRAMEFAKPGMHEYEVEAEMLRVFHQQGAPRTAYDSIVGSGANATILHYRSNRRRIEDGELLLIDAGCELAFYASDITRTFPVGGRFSPAQRTLYEIVLRSQEAAIEAAVVGGSLDSVHDVAVRILSEGMIECGLLEGTIDEAIESESYKQFYMHRTGHWLGLDVHDVGSGFADGKARPLEEGFVLTVEPGIYVAQNADVDPSFRGIGIRIEDDILVTADGPRNLTADVPKTVDAIEALTAG